MIELRIKLDHIDYGGLAQQALPVVLEKLSETHGDSKALQILRGLGGLPGGAVKTMLNAMPQGTKDAVALAFLQSYKEELAGQVNHFAQSKGIQVDVVEIQALRPEGGGSEEAQQHDG